MAWSKTWTDLENINNNRELANGDILNASVVNAMINNVGFMGDQQDDFMEEVRQAIQTGLRLNITSVQCAFDFTYWNTNSVVSGSSGSEIRALSLKNDSTYGNNTVNILPTGCNNSIAEAKVEYVSGDSGYIQYNLVTINENANHIDFTARNISNTSIYSPSNSGGNLKTTTFRLSVKDIYNNVFTQNFTIQYKAYN